MEMQHNTKTGRLLATAACMLLVAACGGGGGGGGGTTPPADSDGDGVANTSDNCPTVANANQLDTDSDGQGDACDTDDDGDGVADGSDNCPLAANADQLDSDGDGAGNVCDSDDDNDTVPDGSDNCPLASNPDQTDTDGDGAGDACDADDDGDGVDDAADNCPLEVNPDQADSDGDGIGDVCDTGEDVTVSGKATYDRVPHNTLTNGLDYTSTTAQPVRGAVVQVLEAGTETVLATTATEMDGSYSTFVPSGTNVFVRVRAEAQKSGLPGWNVSVVDNTRSDALYVLETASFNTGAAGGVRDLHASSGWGGAAYTAERKAAPFAILDSIWTAMQAVLAVDGDLEFPPLAVNWSPANRPVDCMSANEAECEAAGEIGNTFFRRDDVGNREILLLGAEDTDTDEYDGHVIVHEWAHYFEDAFSRADTLGGPHTEGDRLDPRVAYSEGWGYAYSGIATGDPVTRDSLGDKQATGFPIDVESNTVMNPGWYSEGSVQSIIYDIFDANDDGVDALTLGFQPVYDLMTTDLLTSEPPLTIFSFVTRLKALNPAAADAVDAIVANQDIVAVGMDIYGSTETNDAGRGTDVLPVYTDLVVDGAPATVCSLGDDGFGEYNKLSNRRYLTVNIAADATYRFTATGPTGADPDVVLHSQGALSVYEEFGEVEQFDVNMSPGEYTVEVYEFSNVDADSTSRGKTCIDVTVQRL